MRVIAALISLLLLVGATERDARNVDAAALASYQEAIQRLIVVARQRAGTKEEPAILLRLVEAYHKAAIVLYRISHGKASTRGGAADMSAYQNILRASLSPTNRLIQLTPEVPRAFYLRARALSEIGNSKDAIKNYEHLINHFQSPTDLVSAHLYLHDLLIQARDYSRAITYLLKLKAIPSDPHYPVVMDHLGWAHFYLGDVNKAMRYLELEIAHYATAEGRVLPSALVERERALTNLALFWFTALEPQKSALRIAEVEKSIGYFQRQRPSPHLSKMLVYFGNLLRSKRLDAEIEAYKRSALGNDQLSADEQLDVLLVAFENELNRRQFEALKISVQELGVWIPRSPNHPKAKKFIADSAAQLQQSFVKNQDSPESQLIAPTLRALYALILDTTDGLAGKIRVHFNMAELDLLLQDLDSATRHYRWVYENGRGGSIEKPLIIQSQYKAIATRFESLKKNRLLTEALQARSANQVEKKSISQPVREWIDWINDYPWAKSGTQSGVQSIEPFIFEANRLLYASGYVELAVQNLGRMVNAFPRSTYSVPSASLIVDTWVASERWDEAYRRTQEFLKLGIGTKDSKEPDAPFAAKLREIAASSSFKLIEAGYKRGEYADVLDRCDNLMKEYATSKWSRECQVVAGSAALALKDRKRAMRYFEPVIQVQAGAPRTSEALGPAFLTAATLAEEEFDLNRARDHYQKYTLIPGIQRSQTAENWKTLQTKLLYLRWATGQSDPCEGRLIPQCQRFQTALRWTHAYGELSKSEVREAVKKRDDPQDRWVSAVIVIEGGNRAGFNERLRALQSLGQDWNTVDPLLQVAALPSLARGIGPSLKQCRLEVKSIARLRLDKATIDKRVQLLEKLETTVSALQTLPFAPLRSASLMELAQGYLDFSKEIGQLALPLGLSEEEAKSVQQTIAELKAPFDTKAADLTKKAQEVSSTRVPAAEFKGSDDAWHRASLVALKNLDWNRLSYLIRIAQGNPQISPSDQESLYRATVQASLQEGPP